MTPPDLLLVIMRNGIVPRPQNPIIRHDLLLRLMRRIVHNLRMAPGPIPPDILDHERAPANAMVRVHAHAAAAASSRRGRATEPQRRAAELGLVVCGGTASAQDEAQTASPGGVARRAEQPAAGPGLVRHLDVGDVALVAAREAQVAEYAGEPAAGEGPEGRAGGGDHGEVGFEGVGDEADAEVGVWLAGVVVVAPEEVEADGADDGDAVDWKGLVF